MPHTCAIANGGVSCWGRGREGELANGVLADVSFATPTVPAITNATSLGSNGRATCAVLATGRVRCWGQLLGSTFGAPTAIPAFE